MLCSQIWDFTSTYAQSWKIRTIDKPRTIPRGLEGAINVVGGTITSPVGIWKRLWKQIREWAEGANINKKWVRWNKNSFQVVVHIEQGGQKLRTGGFRFACTFAYNFAHICTNLHTDWHIKIIQKFPKIVGKNTPENKICFILYGNVYGIHSREKLGKPIAARIFCRHTVKMRIYILYLNFWIQKNSIC